MIHLDANVVIAILNDRPKWVRARFEQTRDAALAMAISTVVYQELMYGAAASARRRENEERIALFIASGGLSLFPFEEEDAREAADIRAHLKRLGSPIGPYDVIIAAQARRYSATLVTANYKEFKRIPRLNIEDWAAR